MRQSRQSGRPRAGRRDWRVRRGWHQCGLWRVASLGALVAARGARYASLHRCVPRLRPHRPSFAEGHFETRLRDRRRRRSRHRAARRGRLLGKEVGGRSPSRVCTQPASPTAGCHGQVAVRTIFCSRHPVTRRAQNPGTTRDSRGTRASAGTSTTPAPARDKTQAASSLSRRTEAIPTGSAASTTRSVRSGGTKRPDPTTRSLRRTPLP